jgi:hypothetical protein
MKDMKLDATIDFNKEIAEPRKVFQLTPEDRDLINSQKFQIIKLIDDPNPLGLPPVGKHWQKKLELTLSRGTDFAVPIIIKKPWGTIPVQELFGHILQNEHRLLKLGVDSFVPTYPVADLNDTGLFVQYNAVINLPDHISYRDLKQTYQEYLASMGVGVKDFENNAHYTEHGWALFDVEDVV